MADIIPEEGWVIKDDDLPESVTKPRTPEVDEEEKIMGVEIRLWKQYPGTTRNLECLGELPRGTSESLGLGDPWPEFLERQAKKKKGGR
jgi:hypothetical protein